MSILNTGCFIYRLILKCHKPSHSRNISYVQGQSIKSGVREYFYYVDHQGMLFLDNTRMKNFTSCFKDKKFLAFFFSRLRINETGRYMKEFPYISLCGREYNFVRCDDLPIVFTHVIQKPDPDTKILCDRLCYGYADELLTVLFEPDKLAMNVQTGRIYHPAPKNIGGIGLIKSSLAIEFSASFKFDNEHDSRPTQFLWRDKPYILNYRWYTNELLKHS